MTRRGQISTGTLTSLLQESIQGNRIVKAFGMESYEDQRFMQENWKLFKQSLRASRIKAIVSPSMELLASFAIGGVVWYGGWSVIDGGRTQGEFMAFMAAMFLMYGPFKGLSSNLHQRFIRVSPEPSAFSKCWMKSRQSMTSRMPGRRSRLRKNRVS